MAEPFLGQILPFPFNFAPRGWTFCRGQLLQTSQNAALFALLNNIYGGDARSTFGIPDLQGRTPIGTGNGQYLSEFILGEKGGYETIKMSEAQMATHTHDATFVGTGGGSASPMKVTVNVTSNTSGNQGKPDSTFQYLGSALNGLNPVNMWSKTATPAVPLGGVSVSGGGGGITGGVVTNTPSGGTQPIPTRNPYLALNFCIALEGLFPSHNN